MAKLRQIIRIKMLQPVKLLQSIWKFSEEFWNICYAICNTKYGNIYYIDLIINRFLAYLSFLLKIIVVLIAHIKTRYSISGSLMI